MNATKTPHTDAAEFTKSLTKLGFKPAKWDAEGCRILDAKTNTGTVRICMDYEGEPEPHSLTIVKFTDNERQICEWQHANMSAHMPTQIYLTMITALIDNA
jgi:hypothetical protein